MEAMQQPAGTARGQHNERTRGRCKGRQHNNQLIFRRAAALIRGIVICRSAMASPCILVCHTPTAIYSIVFGCAATATARNRMIAMAMGVALEEEGDGKGGKSNGDGNKEGNGKQQQ
jgi:hypothetical protein